MYIIPAIDIKDGNCVRLQKGDYNTVKKLLKTHILLLSHLKMPVQDTYIWLILMVQKTVKCKTPN